MPEKSDNKNQGSPWLMFSLVWLSLILFSWLITSLTTAHIQYSKFINLLNQNQIKEVEISDKELSGTYIDPKSKKEIQFQTGRVPADLAAQLQAKDVVFSRSVDTPELIKWLVPLFLFLLILKAFEHQLPGADSAPANPFNFGKSRARLYKEKDVRITFKDVAGIDEVKAELEEIIDFLKNPEKFRKLGGRLPKGILLVGPPGTGKTLLAKAVAGETKRPFLFITGSEFVELYVGVGAARVRDLFQQALENAPCIIFIDELDALGRARGNSAFAGGHDEKEQTLNQLLAELDGFDPRQGVILLAATNRPEILDPALLRAGRFDRQILVDRPDKIGRVQILQVHMKTVTLDASVKPEEIAAMTTGFTGAELANLVNEAALLAARRSAESIMPADFQNAFERIVAGLEKKNRVIKIEERKIVAFHEMGHALVGLFLNEHDPVEKVSIIPRGISALGYTMQRPQEDRYLLTENELKTKLAILMGGTAAEQVQFNLKSTGSADDLEKATELARHMVSQFGMSQNLGMAVYESGPRNLNANNEFNGSINKNCSERTAREIDCEIRSLINEAFNTATEILVSHKFALDAGAQMLIEKETLSRDELITIKNMSPTESFEPGVKRLAPIS
ncbi:MAG: ATP-dependent zinc metalloprotease FtsH [Candidatus Obscuribacterales bacterium]|nr:ATP-dependent zinc metalloprotease FtsH [Candidatus Obscuribacterales bacterium]